MLQCAGNTLPPAAQTPQRNPRCFLVRAVALALLLAFITIVPNAWLPPSWRPLPRQGGSFAAEPVVLVVPAAETHPAFGSLRLDMHHGACSVFVQPLHDSRNKLFEMGKGTIRVEVPPGAAIILDPAANAGEYFLALGSPANPFLPITRGAFLSGALLVLLAPQIRILRRANSVAQEHHTFAIAFLAAFVFSSAVLYSIVHEFGHVATGVLLGGRAGPVKWTLFSGVEPHVSFVSLPAGAGPWVSANGILFPSIVGLILIAAWLLVRRRLPPISSALLLAPGLSMLLGGLGSIVELFSDPGTGHMDELADHFGLRGPAHLFFCAAPGVLTVMVFALLAVLWRKQRSAYSRDGA